VNEKTNVNLLRVLSVAGLLELELTLARSDTRIPLGLPKVADRLPSSWNTKTQSGRLASRARRVISASSPRRGNTRCFLFLLFSARSLIVVPHVPPLKGSHFAHSPAAQVQKANRVFQVVGKLFSQSEKVGMLKKALPCVVFFKHRNIRTVKNLSGLLRKGKSPLQGGELAIDATISGALALAPGNVGANTIRRNVHGAISGESRFCGP
jgi:hypothetical protein